MVSPHIIGGFLPIYEEGKNDLIELYEHGKSVYEYQYTDTVLWRYSIADASYQVSDIAGVDYSTILFGLATLTLLSKKSTLKMRGARLKRERKAGSLKINLMHLPSNLRRQSRTRRRHRRK